MNKQDFLIWKSRLIELSHEQASTVVQSLSALGFKDKALEETIHDDWLLQGMLLAFKKHGYISSAGMFALRKSRGYKKYLGLKEVLQKDLLTLTGNGRTLSRRDTLAYVVGVAMIQWCKKHCVYPVRDAETKKLISFREQALSVSIILSHVQHSRQALEEQFPGYIDAGMFSIVLEGMTNGKHPSDVAIPVRRPRPIRREG